MRTKKLSKLDVAYIEFLASKIYPDRDGVHGFVVYAKDNFNDLAACHRAHVITPAILVRRFNDMINTLLREVQFVDGASMPVFHQFVVFISRKMFS